MPVYTLIVRSELGSAEPLAVTIIGSGSVGHLNSNVLSLLSSATLRLLWQRGGGDGPSWPDASHADGVDTCVQLAGMVDSGQLQIEGLVPSGTNNMYKLPAHIYCFGAPDDGPAVRKVSL